MKPLRKFCCAFIFAILVFASFLRASAEQKPLTVAEASGFTATSLYADVLAFANELQKLSPFLRVETLCTSTEGRNVPLLIIGSPVPSSPRALKNDGRAVVYIQANIHAGEVEGKEASLMLARDILLQEKPPYLGQLIILIAPIFNADGNEKVSPNNRRSQAGPEKGVGVRHNGQNLDLNRDAMKMESPELRGLIRNVLNRWDPVLLVDCHTTNGSYHEEPVTYSWPLNPNGDASLLKYQRDKMLPEIAATLLKKYETLSVPFGDFMDPRTPEKGWQTFEHHPRYITNYIGLRNRLSILNENYSYADFKTRVFGCYHLLHSILEYCSGHKDEVLNLIAEADRKTVQRGLAPGESDTYGVEFEVKPLPEPLTVRGYEMEVIPREGTWPLVKKSDKKKNYTLPYFADVAIKRSIRFPYAYLMTASDESINRKLLEHGIVVERLKQKATLEVETFKLTEIKGSERLYQGHRMNTVKGTYALETREFPEGTILVRTDQPLANLAACLLEPESDDGLLVWNYFDRYLVPQWGRGIEACPVFRLIKPAALASEIIRTED